MNLRGYVYVRKVRILNARFVLLRSTGTQKNKEYTQQKKTIHQDRHQMLKSEKVTGLQEKHPDLTNLKKEDTPKNH
jgi:hypothetical protein